MDYVKAETRSKRSAVDEQVNARTTGQRKAGMRWVLGLRICGTAGAKVLGEVNARIERGVRHFVTCGFGVFRLWKRCVCIYIATVSTATPPR